MSPSSLNQPPPINQITKLETREKIHSKAQRNTKTKPIHLPSTPENPQNSHTSITQIKSNLKQIPKKKKKKTLDNCDALE